jgi:hypothetical protein
MRFETLCPMHAAADWYSVHWCIGWPRHDNAITSETRRMAVWVAYAESDAST